MFLIKDKNSVYFKDEYDNVMAYITFPNVRDGVVNIDHTYVNPELRGQGIAEKMIVKVIEILKNSNRKAILSCEYAKAYFKKHPEFAELTIKEED